jgi:hypothetical protein
VLLKRADAVAALGLDVWEFTALSLLRPYGRFFLGSILLRRPDRLLAGTWTYGRQVRPARTADHAPVGVSSWQSLESELAEGPWLVGMGFCQKPLAPPCPSGRFNHQCWFLTRPEGAGTPPACRTCHIREIAERALAAGAAIYIMTSASDVARDLLLPALRGGSLRRAVLSVCPLSVPPLTLAMTICGLRGFVDSYSEGDCRDFAMWLRADEGDKPELTRLPPEAHARLLARLENVAAARRRKGVPKPHACRESGNFYVPARVD